MVKTEKLDRELWENHKVIVSPAFLESTKDTYENRKNKKVLLKKTIFPQKNRKVLKN